MVLSDRKAESGLFFGSCRVSSLPLFHAFRPVHVHFEPAVSASAQVFTQYTLITLMCLICWACAA